MRKLTTFLLLLAFSLQTRAQAPQALNYQAVARNTAGSVLAGQAVNVRFTVIDGTVGGTTVYQETQAATTNAYGLFTLAIGRGTVVSGTFAGVNWGGGDKFLKVEVSTDGGATYALQGTTQFLSVPYALYAQRTNLVGGTGINITGGNTINGAYTAGTGISITGATIAGNYTGSNGVAVTGSNITGAYTGSNGVNVSGSTISGTYTGTNGVNVSGSTISGAYTGGTGINVTGSTISSNLVAGTGIQITGNTISSTNANSQWLTDANGINYQPGNVGIRMASTPASALSITQQNTNGNSGALLLTSSDPWHTAFSVVNSSHATPRQFTFSFGGSGNGEVGPTNFGIINTSLLRWNLIFSGTTGNVGIGSMAVNAPAPKSALHVFSGDVNVDQIGSGIIMKSPNGQCWRVTIDNSGNFVRTAITCP